MDAEWDLDALCRRAEAVLEEVDASRVDGRVRARPDARTVRYYTTLGLIDRPLVRGRSGYYGRRHLMQLVAIKRLQAEGASLAEVQARLMGLEEGELAALARIGDGAGPVASEPAPRRRFWAVCPEDEAADSVAGTSVGEDAVDRRDFNQSTTAVPLARGVLLLLATDRLTDADLKEVREAASPLLALLERKHHFPGGTGKEPKCH